MRLDEALGPSLNLEKCARSAIAPVGKRLPTCAYYDLERIQFRKSFRYLGIALVLGYGASKPVTERRIQAFIQRCKFIKMLPRHQLGICLADAISALWADGSAAYSKRQMSKAVSVGAEALMGKSSHGTSARRSRPMTHVLGPGVHRTHLATTIYAVTRQYGHMIRSGTITPGD